MTRSATRGTKPILSQDIDPLQTKPATGLKPEGENHDARHPHPVDNHVGQRVRIRRILHGISQEKLGEELGITFQQIQKYEKGSNRISASRLWQICHVLKTDPAFFFEGLSDMAGVKAASHVNGSGSWASGHLAEPATSFAEDGESGDTPNSLNAHATPNRQESQRLAEQMQSSEALKLVSLYFRIPDPEVRRRVMALVKSMVEAETSMSRESQPQGV